MGAFHDFLRPNRAKRPKCVGRFFKSSRDLPDSLNILLLFHWHLTDCFIHLLKEDSFESLLKTLECYL